MAQKGVKILSVEQDSIAYQLGVQPGDRLYQINRRVIGDIIDYMYYQHDEPLRLSIIRDDAILTFDAPTVEGASLGIQLQPFRVQRCANRCDFCFVSQLPTGLRETLYIRDDDFRLSFLYGNYITLTNLTDSARKRIIRQKLSPLYISVHTVNGSLRQSMMNNPKAGDILEEIKFLVSHKIRLHTQIVLCEGMNDGDELTRTIQALYQFYPYLATIAVVPVGLTKFHQGVLKPLSKQCALKTLETIAGFAKKFHRRHGEAIVYGSDELYLNAEVPIPSYKHYGDFEQIENGVGMVALFFNELKSLRLPRKIEPKTVSTITGASFAPFLNQAIEKFNKIEGLTINAYQVENSLFGPNVTVAGLLTGRCIMKSLDGKDLGECLLIPDVMLRDGDYAFLDNITVEHLQEILGVTVKAIHSTPSGLLEGVL
jgi:putative radical SAM enzyme (TIGR03279 family)